jgi:hypothetical protein
MRMPEGILSEYLKLLCALWKETRWRNTKREKLTVVYHGQLLLASEELLQ